MRTIAALMIFGIGAAGGDRLLTVHKLADTFGIYDAETGEKRAEIAVGKKPHEFGLSADAKYAYVTDYGVDTYTTDVRGGNTITVIDLAEQKTAGVIELGEYRRPHGIERGKSGLFYVTTDFPAALLVVDAGRRKVVASIALSGKLPHMVQVAHDERKAWTANAGTGNVSVVDLAAKRETATIDIGGVPMGFAMTRDERRLYATTRTGNQVVEIDPGKALVAARIDMKGEPSRLLFSADEKRLLVSLIVSNEVAAVDVATNREVRRVAAGARPEGMTLSPDGKSFYISAQGDNEIHRMRIADFTRVLTIKTSAKPDPLLVVRGQ
jgi:YVTN family beta-propeller protein